MKKVLSVIAIILAVLTIYFCFFDKDSTGTKADNEEQLLESILQNKELYPLYNSLSTEEKQAYVKICTALNSFSKSTAMIYESSSMADAKQFGRSITSLYREIVYEQSEIFWVDPYVSELVIQELDGKCKVFIEPTYILEKEDALTKKEQFDKTIEKIVNEAKKKPTDFEKILYVYDYILENCSYDESLVEDEDAKTTAITAYGCLMEGKTVCSGYTLAFDAIMKRLGFECGAEFNNYSSFSILTGHVWNYCKIEGEYYYFDLTWDDTGYDSDAYKKYFDHGHEYFAITKEELEKSNFTLSPDAPTPPCNGKKYNYFIRNGYNLSVYSLEAAKELISKQVAQNYVIMRFDSYGELLKAQSDLLEDGKIYDIVPGKDKIKYVTSHSNLHLYIFFED